jgi:hypothetical protein
MASEMACDGAKKGELQQKHGLLFFNSKSMRLYNLFPFYSNNRSFGEEDRKKKLVAEMGMEELNSVLL